MKKLLLWIIVAHLGFLSIPYGTGETMVAVLDSGVNAEPRLQGQLLSGYDFVQWDTDPSDEHGHGTDMAALIIEKAPTASVLPIRVLDETATSNGSTFLGILYAIVRGADLVNMSLSESNYNPLTHWSIWLGELKGVIFVASSGNNGKTDINYPGKYDGVISVGAIYDKTEEVYERSNISHEVDFVASGVNVPSKVSTDTRTVLSGTSVSAAQVSGIIAYILEQDPLLTSRQVEQVLFDFSYSVEGKYRRIDFQRLVAHYNQEQPYYRLPDDRSYIVRESLIEIPYKAWNIRKISLYQNGEYVATVLGNGNELRIELRKKGLNEVSILLIGERESEQEDFLFYID